MKKLNYLGLNFKNNYGIRGITLNIANDKINIIKIRLFSFLFDTIIDIILFIDRYLNKLFLPVARTEFLLLKDIVIDKAFYTLFDNKLEKKSSN